MQYTGQISDDKCLCSDLLDKGAVYACVLFRTDQLDALLICNVFCVLPRYPVTPDAWSRDVNIPKLRAL